MRKRSICLTVATVLASAYAIYLMVYFIGGTAMASGTDAIGGAIATALVMPHMISVLVGAVFGWLGVALKKGWAALVAAILYSVATLLFLAYAMFTIPLLILGFVGFANQKKLNKKNAQ